MNKRCDMILLYFILGILSLIFFVWLLYIGACAVVVLVSIICNIYKPATEKMTREEFAQKVEASRKRFQDKKSKDSSVQVEESFDDKTPYYT